MLWELRQTTTATVTRTPPTKKDLMSETMAVQVRYKSLHISLPSTAKQPRKATQVCVYWRLTRTTAANISYFLLALNAGITYLVLTRSETDKRIE